MTDGKFKLISKYALLLSISYIVEFALSRYYLGSVNTDLLSRTNQFLILAAPTILTLLFNIIVAAIVHRDKETQNLKTKYVILATVLYRPIGVVAFLLYSIYNNWTEDEGQTNKG
jgi:hypothetical protein